MQWMFAGVLCLMFITWPLISLAEALKPGLFLLVKILKAAVAFPIASRSADGFGRTYNTASKLH
jgi:hypothetical protein